MRFFPRFNRHLLHNTAFDADEEQHVLVGMRQAAFEFEPRFALGTSLVKRLAERIEIHEIIRPDRHVRKAVRPFLVGRREVDCRARWNLALAIPGRDGSIGNL